jgi:hypothetical protein
MTTIFRNRIALAAAALLAVPSLASAQSGTPTPEQPATAPATEPPATTTPAPQSAPPEERKLRTATEEEEEAETPPPEDPVFWGVGAYARFITIPTFVFDLFVEHSTAMNQYAIAGSVIRRKGNFDIVLTLEYAATSPEDGLWQEKDEIPGMPGMDPDIVIFDNLAMISVDASFIWHVPLTDFMAFRYGVGIGVGVKLGSYTHQDTMCPAGTRIDDLDDPDACTPIAARPAEEDDIPPVLPVVNLTTGLRFKIVDQLSLQVELGWRFPAFYAGAGVGYFF